MRSAVKKISFFIMAFMVITLMLLDTTDVSAGGSNEMTIIDYTPQFSVEALKTEVGIKVSIPKQHYLYAEYSKEYFYPAGYEITIMYADDPYSKDNYDFSEHDHTKGLYKTYYPNIPTNGFGPYKNEPSTIIGKALDYELDGSKDQTITINDINPGKYVVYLRAFSFEPDSLYYKNKSREVSKEIKVKDVEEKETAAGYKTKYNFSKVKKGDTIKFGAYEQDKDITNGKEPIEWIVLSKTKTEIFVISKYVLDKLPFNNEYTSVTWKDSSLRKWLNDSFYSTAFNTSEQKLISTTTLKNKENPTTGVKSGSDTKDKVFILSYQDVLNSSYGFSTKALKNDSAKRTSFAYNVNAGGRWWIRTPAYDQYHMLFVSSEGSLEYEYGAGTSAYYGALGVRPAMYIKIK